MKNNNNETTLMCPKQCITQWFYNNNNKNSHQFDNFWGNFCVRGKQVEQVEESKAKRYVKLCKWSYNEKLETYSQNKKFGFFRIDLSEMWTN